MSAFGQPGCRSCCASMEEEERPSATGGRAVPVNSRAPKGNAPNPCTQLGLVMGGWADQGVDTENTLTSLQKHRRWI